jgi:predicted PurR-regulated permease PerM
VWWQFFLRQAVATVTFEVARGTNLPRRALKIKHAEKNIQRTSGRCPPRLSMALADIFRSHLATRTISVHMNTLPRHHDTTAMEFAITAAIVVGGLYWARDVLIPLALAVLISFVLAPVVLAVRSTGLPRTPAAILVVLIAFGSILGLGALGATQLSQLVDNLPQYQQNIKNKIRLLRGVSDGAMAARATSVIEDISRELTGGRAQEAASPRVAGGPGVVPLAVEVRAPNPNPLKVASDLLQPLLNPLASTGLVILFVILFLLQREDLRDRIIKLLGTNDLHRTTELMDEAASRLGRYFLLQTMLNAGFGAVAGCGLWVIGVPSPLLWGIFTMLMRFVPYVGSMLAAVLPVALAAAVDPGWTMVSWTLALFLIGEPVMGSVAEPMVFGHQTGLSPVAIVLAATFWTWLWGPIGLILATPLTLCLVLLGQYSKPFEFLRVLLGDQPALTPAENFYQRLIAGDPAELIEQAEGLLKDHSLLTYFDDVALQGLVLAQNAATSGELTPERQTLLFHGVTDLIGGLPDMPRDGFDVSTGRQAIIPGNSTALAHGSVLCIGGRGAVDQAAAAMLAQLLEREGIGATLSDDQVGDDRARRDDPRRAVDVICLSYVGTTRPAHVRFMVRRLRRAFPASKILIGLWLMPADAPDRLRITETAGADLVASTFHEALGQVGGALHVTLQPLTKLADVAVAGQSR